MAVVPFEQSSRMYEPRVHIHLDKKMLMFSNSAYKTMGLDNYDYIVLFYDTDEISKDIEGLRKIYFKLISKSNLSRCDGVRKIRKRNNGGADITILNFQRAFNLDKRIQPRTKYIPQYDEETGMFYIDLDTPISKEVVPPKRKSYQKLMKANYNRRTSQTRSKVEDLFEPTELALANAG